MCNACGFLCCGSDQFEGCGCEHCDNPACWPRCDLCGAFETDCSCYDEDPYPEYGGPEDHPGREDVP